MTLVGATGSLLKRSLASMQTLVDNSVAEVRSISGMPLPLTVFSLAALVQDARTSAQLEADLTGCILLVAQVDPVLRVDANRDLLLGSLGNLLSNAFKFTHRHSAVKLNAYALGDRIVIDVEDRCGGLASKYEEAMFAPFVQLGADRSGLELGLTIARENVESMGATFTVKNVPEAGCVFTIGLPNCTLDRRTDAAPSPAT